MSDTFDHYADALDRHLNGEGSELGEDYIWGREELEEGNLGFRNNQKVEITQEHRNCYTNLMNTANAHGYKRGWVYYRLKDYFGEEVAKELCCF